MPNVVLIMTDTQHAGLMGAAGHPVVDTPCLDALAASGLRCASAFTTCPLCTPARAALFTGLYAPVAGAWANNLAPQAGTACLGEIVRRNGRRAAYCGKWHLDGAGYYGDGEPGGGFEPAWWYDGATWAREIGPDAFQSYRRGEASRLGAERLWGHRVADRAIDFLEQVGDDPFVLVASFDEPHGPYVAPEAWWRRARTADLPCPGSWNADLAGKPAQQRLQAAEEAAHLGDWATYREGRRRYLGCLAWIDGQIGRIVDAVRRLHGDDTVILFTSDHGSMDGAHGLTEKGPMQYDEVVRVPFLAAGPGIAAGSVHRHPVSHIDILPTILDLLGIAVPPLLHGLSLAPLLRGDASPTRACAFHGFDRFAINHDGWGGFYPVRAASDGRHTLVLNLLDDCDEFYDRADDPWQLANRIDTPSAVRDALHDAILAEMDRVRDPMRGWRWGARSWRTVCSPVYSQGARRRERPAGFPWQPAGVSWT
jgi:uncharacterized sulfatase